MHFGENQLSRNLIGLSPLAAPHPLNFHIKWVRASTRSHPRFTLDTARSSRFGHRTRDWNALFGLALATPPPHGLGSPHATDSQAHFSIGTPSPHKKALTVRGRTVSGTVSLPSRGAFHLSLTVLIHYRSHRHIQAYPTVGADSHGIPRVPRYSGNDTGRRRAYAYGAITLYGQASNPVPLARRFVTAPGGCGPRTIVPTTPAPQPPQGVTRHRFSLLRFRSPLLTEYLFLRVLRCFTSPRTSPPERMGDSQRLPGYPIRKSWDQSPVGGSPRPIAAPHVLHQTDAPRHPPLRPSTGNTTPADHSEQNPGQQINTKMT